jgi:NAD(P)-dependent dehydrogenase (short-subunit alcohol dehydrogenase family)
MQRILITGANRGIGLELVRHCLARADRVIATCRHPGKALALTELAAAHPGHLRILPLELASEQSIAEAAREVAALTDALDALINNAGMLVSGERFGAIAHKSMVDSFATNVIGPVLLAQSLSPLLQKGTRPKVLNISTRLASLAGTTAFGTPSYSMSKTALNMATRQLAAALAPHGVTVFCASPGWVRTDMGGTNAAVSAPESAAGLIKVLDAAGPDMAGRFVDYLGAEIAW